MKEFFDKTTKKIIIHTDSFDEHRHKWLLNVLVVEEMMKFTLEELSWYTPLVFSQPIADNFNRYRRRSSELLKTFQLDWDQKQVPLESVNQISPASLSWLH